MATSSPPASRLARTEAEPSLRAALYTCRAGLAAVALFSLGINLLLLAAPLYMLQIYDRVLSSRSVDTLLYLTLIVAAAFLTLAALEMVRSGVLIRLGTWLDRRLGPDVLSANIRAALEHGATRSPQGLRDLSAVRMFLTGSSVLPLLDAPWTPLFIAVVFLLHPTLGWLACGGAIALLVLAALNDQVTRRALDSAGRTSTDALGHAEAAVRNADAIEAMGMMPGLIRRWCRDSEGSQRLQASANQRSAAIRASAKFLRLMLQAGMFGLGAWLVLGNEITPGTMIAAAILMARALAPVDMAIGAWRSTAAALHAGRRLAQTLAQSPASALHTQLPAPEGVLRVAALSYAHPDAPAPALRGISFSLSAGESLGLIGPTASGKTTLARLLVGNLCPRTGHVRLDGADVSQWRSDDLGRHIGYLPQTIELFDGTARENIERFTDGPSDDAVAAAKLAGVHELVLGLPDGYETRIGEAGAVLSGGQRQRIALARALYGGPKLVVLDEPNANLDQTGEAALLSAMARLKSDGATLVVIAHRPSVLRHVDKILVLRQGTMARFGPRDETLAQIVGPVPERRLTGASGG